MNLILNRNNPLLISMDECYQPFAIEENITTWSCNYIPFFQIMSAHIGTKAPPHSSIGILEGKNNIKFRCEKCKEEIDTQYNGVGWGKISYPRSNIIVFGNHGDLDKWIDSLLNKHSCN